ncbi:PREDICTED: tetraspanin-11 [Tarenaya hassleriana]|uniref:tetraspanin-11 n=1 Tax=Tarenaya hassleriana TaxID=28532 RepID=UPI00053C6A60|nr:PREDICTED: tetraspanin-11 [Tarenaya hassleriana]
MFRVSNFLVGLANALVMLVGASAIGFSLYLFLHGNTNCENALKTPLLVTGTVLFVISLMGIIGSCFKSNFVLVLYLTVLFISIVSLIGFSVFAFLVTNEGAGHVVSGRGYKEYRTGDFSNWLRNHFVDGKRWDGVRACLVQARVCSGLGGRVGQIADAFYHKNLSPIQSGCCKPPSECDFEFKNATWWEPRKGSAGGQNATAAAEGDCDAWSNAQTELCFGCNSCKAGVLENIRQKWRHLLIFNVCLIVLIITVYLFGCCARRNNRTAVNRCNNNA